MLKPTFALSDIRKPTLCENYNKQYSRQSLSTHYDGFFASSSAFKLATVPFYAVLVSTAYITAI